MDDDERKLREFLKERGLISKEEETAIKRGDISTEQLERYLTYRGYPLPGRTEERVREVPRKGLERREKMEKPSIGHITDPLATTRGRWEKQEARMLVEQMFEHPEQYGERFQKAIKIIKEERAQKPKEPERDRD